MTHASTLKSQRTQRIVYDALVKAALAGEACPSNSDLCTLVGSSTVSTPAHAISLMAKAGRLRVTHCSNGREIHIVEHDITIVSKMRITMLRKAALAPKAPCDAPAEKLPPIVDRDPCFRCGVRADIGCEHSPAWQRSASTMGAAA
jgi:hypothetical protein